MPHWLLPESIEDVLPDEAWRMELLRRCILDLFHVHGYQYVIPPMIEHVESLVTGIGHDLDLLTFKVVDQLSGRLLGIRSDITPQTARIDAHLLNQQGVTRLCYAGSVLRTQPSGTAHTREPLQIGAELFGHTAIESDIEIQQLLVKTLHVAGISNPHLDFSHVGIFRSLIRNIEISSEDEAGLLLALQAKDIGAIHELTTGVDDPIRQALKTLPTLYGNRDVIQAARNLLPPTHEIVTALNELEAVANGLSEQAVSVSFDLADLRGYQYHSGIVFAAYAEGYPGALAFGGRYDEVGEIFGRSRPATGFSMDIRAFVGKLSSPALNVGILAPALNEVSLQEKIKILRAAGEVVVSELPGHVGLRSELNCNRTLVKDGNEWNIVPIDFES